MKELELVWSVRLPSVARACELCRYHMYVCVADTVGYPILNVYNYNLEYE